MQTDYTTCWSILNTPSKSISSTSVFLWVTICAVLLWFLTKLKKENDDGDRKIMLWATGAFAVVGLAGYISLTYIYPDKSHEKVLEMLNATTTPRVEGVVSNFERTFRQTRYGNETIEKFTVDSVQFAYSDALFGKFNSFSQTHNNVMFNGQRVRITYWPDSFYEGKYNAIIKIEIAK